MVRGSVMTGSGPGQGPQGPPTAQAVHERAHNVTVGCRPEPFPATSAEHPAPLPASSAMHRHACWGGAQPRYVVEADVLAFDVLGLGSVARAAPQAHPTGPNPL